MRFTNNFHTILLAICLVLQYQQIGCQEQVRKFSVQAKKSKDQALIYLHIPKAGGTAVSKPLMNNWCEFGCSQARILDTSFQSYTFATPENAVQVSNTNAQCYWMIISSGPRGHQGRKTVPHMVMKQGLNLRYGTGHIPFGYCQFMESPCEYTTIFRQPIDRLISQYFYIQQRHPFLLKKCDDCQTFQTYVSSLLNKKATLVGGDNVYTRFVCGASFEKISGQKLTEGRDCGDISFGEVNQTHFEIAKENILAFFPVVGLLHDLETYQALLLLEYGYLPYTVPRARQTVTRNLKVKDLDAESLSNVQELLKWDLKLWDFVKDLVRKRTEEYKSFESALNYVRNFDPNLPKIPFLERWNKSSVVSGDQAPALLGQLTQ